MKETLWNLCGWEWGNGALQWKRMQDDLRHESDTRPSSTVQPVRRLSIFHSPKTWSNALLSCMSQSISQSVAISPAREIDRSSKQQRADSKAGDGSDGRTIEGQEDDSSYNLAKTPLMAAHTPLAAAMGIQGALGLVDNVEGLLFVPRDGGGGSVESGSRSGE